MIACERDARRAGVLRRRAADAAGASVRVVQTDFMAVDPRAPPYADVTAVQLDPTCSGSGMVERASYQLGGAEEEEGGAGGGGAKLHAIAATQLELLTHALSFPAAPA